MQILLVIKCICCDQKESTAFSLQPHSRFFSSLGCNQESQLMMNLTRWKKDKIFQLFFYSMLPASIELFFFAE